ncbi:MAG: reactive intermediate/imine deaminase [Phototrophicales bacterium]|nr:MAG: reactive intermediate/imine deaminase [Phototrophicales bacterium]
MSRQVVRTENAPGAVGPYAQGIIANGFIFTAGQTGLIPGTKTLPEGVAEQTRQVLNNIKGILEAAGTSMDKIVKTTVYLQDIKDFATMNEVYASFFSGDPPARTTVEVAALPLGALVEIEAVALI